MLRKQQYTARTNAAIGQQTSYIPAQCFSNPFALRSNLNGHRQTFDSSIGEKEVNQRKILTIPTQKSPDSHLLSRGHLCPPEERTPASRSAAVRGAVIEVPLPYSGNGQTPTRRRCASARASKTQRTIGAFWYPRLQIEEALSDYSPSSSQPDFCELSR